MYYNKFTIVIFHKGSDPRRILNLKSLLSYLKTIDKFNIIVIEQDKTPKDQKEIENFDVQYIFDLNEKDNYSKTRAYNLAAKKVTTDFICFHDSDIIIQEHIYKFCTKFFDNYDVIKPYNKIIEMNNPETDKFYQKPEYFLPLNFKVRDSNISGGIMFINRKAFWSIGGWDEEIWGYGGEDDCLDHAILKCLTLKTFGSISLHLIHKKLYLEQGRATNNHLVAEFTKLTKEQILERAKQYAPST